MKAILSIIFLTMLLFSCSKELHITRQTIKNSDKVIALSNKLFPKFNKETFFVPNDLDSLGLDKSEIRLLTRKLKCPYIHLIYNERKPRFFESDSVVLFTRTGLPIFGKQHNIIVDMKQTKRDSIPVDRHYIKYYKVLTGIYYIQEYMPEF